MTYELASWKFHAGNMQAESSLSCAVGSLVARNVYVARNPAEFDRFASIDEICSVWCFEYQIQLHFETPEGFEAWHRVRENDKFSIIATTDEIHGRSNRIQFVSENACFVW